MMTCEECGSLVDPDEAMLQKHADWHEEVITKKDLTYSALANPNRTRLDNIIAQDC